MFMAGVAAIFFLINIINRAFATAIARLYKTTIVPAMPNGESRNWDYFIVGQAAISAAFLPLVTMFDNRRGAGGGDSGGCGGGCCGGGGGCGGAGGCGGCGGGD